MTREELMKLQTYKLFEDEEAVYVDRNDVLELLERDHCEDAISRADAVKVASGYCHPSNIAEELAKLPPVTPQQKVGHCKDCKRWKDSDGTYRRGVGAESQCPINSMKVFEGNGYCYMFEPQESENKE